MKKNKKVVLQLCIFFCYILLFTGCEAYLEPDYDNTLTESSLVNPFKAEGLLIKAYTYLPGGWDESDLATDNAVSNISNGYTNAATGSLTSSNNPFGTWSNSYGGINYANLFLTYVDKVRWDTNPETNAAFVKRLKGEAIALRAYYECQLLKQYGGYDNNGELLGIPILKQIVEISDEWKSIKRSSYKDCVDKILLDIEEAIKCLPDKYVDGDDYEENLITGSKNGCRMSANVMRMLKAQLLLTAASPAFSKSSSVKWEDAANAAAELINKVGGLDNMTNNRTTFYKYNGVANIDSDILWRRVEGTSYSMEESNFPNSLRGNGRINPTQNLVSSFPAKNGYPIDNVKSNFDPNKPFFNRDPRLDKYIVYNGSKLGKTKAVIYTTENDKLDGINKVPNKTTRTGYYLRKFLNETVVTLFPKKVGASHFFAIMRCTELYLIYAEAANEAWGPQGKGANNYSAYDVIKRLRKTAGIDEDDLYLESIKDNQTEMRKLIQNERRIELCFEGKRFWDIRRWNSLDLLKEPAKRTLDGGLTTDIQSAEDRVYDDYMIYLPIPQSEELKGLSQNKDW